MNYAYSYEFETGKLWICTDENSLIEISFNDNLVSRNTEIKETELILKVKSQLEEYFSGKRKTFDLPLNPQGTEFQKRVWQALTKIPYGETCCYKDIAIAIGNPKASRAIGMANNKNPIPIIIPCHRVIGKNGNLTGYAGGLDIKRKLLEFEYNVKNLVHRFDETQQIQNTQITL